MKFLSQTRLSEQAAVAAASLRGEQMLSFKLTNGVSPLGVLAVFVAHDRTSSRNERVRETSIGGRGA